nr:hypothetical protein [Nanoarchaeum sp.]
MFNSIQNELVRVIVVFFVLFFIFRLAYIILQKIVLRLTIKTKTDLDDLIVKRTSTPVSVLFFLVSLNMTIEDTTLLVEATQDTISKLIYTLMAVNIIYIIYVIINLLIERSFKRFAQKTKSKLDDTLLSLIHNVMIVGLIVISVIYVLSIWGVEILPILGALGVAGIAVALALQPTLANIFSGAAMIVDKSVSVGDLIYLDGSQQVKGKVEKVGLRSTRIITFDNEMIIIPNSKLADSIIQNVAQPEPKSRVVVPFTVAYGTDIEKVKKLILKEIVSVKYFVKDPEPTVRFVEMGNSSLNFKAYYYVESYDHRFESIDDANTKIYNALNKAGIEIPFPHLDVRLKK